jgi:uncharacterized membrane protein
MKMAQNIRFITEAAVIAAMYAALTLLFAPISYGQLQVRVSEALTVLPFLTPAAIPGLFTGCIIANFLGTGTWVDTVFGSLATLLAAVLSYKMPRKYFAPLPPIIINGIVVGFILNYLYQLPLLITMGWVALGESIACYGLGYPLLLQLGRIKFFKRED